MKCLRCQHPESKVLESRESRDGTAMRRRRECMECGYRFTTFERFERPPLYVVKKNSQARELFDRDKLLRSLSIACQKRSVSADVLMGIVDKVEVDCRALDREEVSSKQVGEFILAALWRLDPVAYVRFASVYREFSTLEDFTRELNTLANPPSSPV